ncbi:MAG: phospholipase D-like domain-containing protein [Elusimicrobiota bacterium]|jgi:cardiolipin synthase|nr:phospholipase D-like domain-containing protein [Elusimicrobiota bacterium]
MEKPFNFFTFTYIIISVVAAVHILLYKENVKSSIGWIAVIFFSPFIGTLFYVLFGINRVKRKSLRLRRKSPFHFKLFAQNKNLRQDFYSKHKKLIDFSSKIYPQDFTLIDAVAIVQNGDNAYPQMAEIIKSAKREILISSYIFDFDNETQKFLEAFKNATDNGAKIKVLVDGIGGFSFSKKSIQKKLLKIKGIEYASFLPPHIPAAMPFANLRNHRKIMIIDGKTAFFGGMNLSRANVLTNNKKGIVDITLKISGPIIKQMCDIFENDWEFASGKSFTPFMAETNVTKNENLVIPARIISDGPDSKTPIIKTLFSGAISFAQKKVLIVTPYFLPDDEVLFLLKTTALKGVDVEIFIPSESNHFFMDWAAEPVFGTLIESGVKIYKTDKPFDHSKIFMIDEEWIFAGSANWDTRSFELNFESIIELFSKDLAKEFNLIVDCKRQKAKKITIADCKNKSIYTLLRNKASRLLMPYY